MLEIPEGYDKGLSFTIDNLKEKTKYSIVVQAFNDHGKGPMSRDVVAMTSEGGMSPALSMHQVMEVPVFSKNVFPSSS